GTFGPFAVDGGTGVLAVGGTVVFCGGTGVFCGGTGALPVGGTGFLAVGGACALASPARTVQTTSERLSPLSSPRTCIEFDSRPLPTMPQRNRRFCALRYRLS